GHRGRVEPRGAGVEDQRTRQRQRRAGGGLEPRGGPGPRDGRSGGGLGPAREGRTSRVEPAGGLYRRGGANTAPPPRCAAGGGARGEPSGDPRRARIDLPVDDEARHVEPGDPLGEITVLGEPGRVHAKNAVDLLVDREAVLVQPGEQRAET